MDANDWDARYAAADLLWSAPPNGFVAELLEPLPPGHALDVAAGEGRNAIWLVERGWAVVAIDYSSVAVERMRVRAAERLGDRAGGLTTHVADATMPAPGGPAACDVVLFCYLHLPPAGWAQALGRGVDALRNGGRLVVIGHAARNLTEGHGGPSDAAVLYDPADVLATVEGLPVAAERAEIRERAVETDDGPRQALDTVVVLRRR